jgi:acyl dehydratase
MRRITATGDKPLGSDEARLPEYLPNLLTETRRMLGCAPDDVPPGTAVADWLHISRVVEATGDGNPLYLDPHYGARSWWRAMLAPPAFVLAIAVPESSGAQDSRAHNAVDLLTHIDLWWRDHIRLGDRVGAGLRIAGVDWGQRWRGRDTIEITSEAQYLSEHREVAASTGIVKVHPLQSEHELFVERAIHEYSEEDIVRIIQRLDGEPQPRGARPRFYQDVSIADPLPELVKGPITWSDLITWIIAEGRPAPAGNLHHRTISARPGRQQTNLATGWPVSDRRQAREDAQTCEAVGFPAPCVRGSLLVALASQLITTWMGDSAFLRHLSVSLESPVLYGDSIFMSGEVVDKFTQKVGDKKYFATWVEVIGVNQLAGHVLRADGLVYLPEPGRPVVLPVESGGA